MKIPFTMKEAVLKETGLGNNRGFQSPENKPLKSNNNQQPYSPPNPFDPNDSPIPLIVDTSSLYSEFDDGVCNSMRIMFRIRESVVEKGGLRLVWGNEISVNNTQVDQISIYREDKDRYRTFNWEAQPEGDDGGSYAATLEVIVDDYADTYYLWYLLPMALIFTLLFVKKIALK